MSVAQPRIGTNHVITRSGPPSSGTNSTVPPNSNNSTAPSECSNNVSSAFTRIVLAVDENGSRICDNGQTSSNSIRFDITGVSNGTGASLAGFQCNLDKRGFVPCISPSSFFGQLASTQISVSINNLTSTTHTFQARIVNQTGRADPNPPTYKWSVQASSTKRPTMPKTQVCIGGLPCGDWTINANGLIGHLSIQVVNRQGVINGTLNLYTIYGSWDEISKKVTFVELLPNQRILFYSGFLNNLCMNFGSSINANEVTPAPMQSGSATVITPSGPGTIITQRSPVPMATPSQSLAKPASGTSTPGCLALAGSFVPLSAAQVHALRLNPLNATSVPISAQNQSGWIGIYLGAQ